MNYDQQQGLMRPEKAMPSEAKLEQVRQALGPANVSPSLSDALESMSDAELEQLQSTAKMVRMSVGFDVQMNGESDSYADIVTRMYPRMAAEKRRLLVALLEDLEPLSAGLVRPSKQQSQESITASVLDGYNAILEAAAPKSADEPDITSQLIVAAREYQQPSQPSSYSKQQSSQSLLQRPAQSQSFTGKQDFISRLTPVAKEVAANLGISHKIILAQAALESGYGKHQKSNNLMGIKSHGEAGGVDVVTHEVVNGKKVKITDSFRQYDTPEDSIRGYGSFLRANSRYKHFLRAGADNVDAQLSALQSSGYASDPRYAFKLRNIMNGLPDEEGQG